jgi:RNA polymerase sigma factor for flagellar operon FliA
MRMRTAATTGSENLEARDALVMSHVGLVKAMANRLARRLPPQVEVSELIGVGVLGLIDAAGRYRPSLGVPFDAFARCRIHGAMLDALRGLDWAPRAVRKMRRDVDSTIAKLRHTLGREPETAEVARAMNVSEEQYDRMLDQLRSADLATIRRGRQDESGANLLEVAIGPDEDGPHARLERRELVQLLARALGDVPERERHILSLYYEHELTLAEIGKVIGVGESRVSQLRTQAIARLRSRMTELLAIPSEQER